ncbi:hypothetical protein [Nocardia sp. MW-W600-9]
MPAGTISSGFDGPAEDGKAYRVGVGHNVPQEVPRPFAQAVIDADRL